MFNPKIKSILIHYKNIYSQKRCKKVQYVCIRLVHQCQLSAICPIRTDLIAALTSCSLRQLVSAALAHVADARASFYAQLLFYHPQIQEAVPADSLLTNNFLTPALLICGLRISIHFRHQNIYHESQEQSGSAE